MSSTTYKNVAQTNISTINSWTNLYTVPALSYVIAQPLLVCNQNNSQAQVSIRVRVAGAAADSKQVVYSSTFLDVGETKSLLIPILGASDVVEVQASQLNVSFNLSGTLNTQ
jgi:hypothetical protein